MPAAHRVAGGGRPPPAPTERGVRISRTTLFGVARREVSTDSDLNRDSAAGLQKGHERGRTVSDVARNICAGADGVCLHHDLFNHPLFDGGLKPAWPAKSRHPVRQAVAALYALTQ